MKISKKNILYLLLFISSIILLFYRDELYINLQHKYYQTINNINRKAPESTIETINFSPKTYANTNKEIKIYLPKDYTNNKEKKYPALYLLHGFPGNGMDWLINADIQNKLDELIDNKKIPPIIVVLPDGNGPIVQDSQYLNATKINQPAQDYIIEIVNEIDSRYRTITQRDSRAIGGLSAGGYGSVNISFHRNDLFSIILSHSGYFINNEGVTKKLLNRSDLNSDYNNPLKYIEGHNLNPKTYIYLDIGSSDNKNYIKDNEEMNKILSSKNIIHQFNITKGWHDWEVWKKNITLSLEFLGKYISTNP